MKTTIVCRRFCKSVKSIPQPLISSDLKSQIFGHFEEVSNARQKDENHALGIYRLTKKWYEDTGSNTVKIRLLYYNMIMTSDPNFYKEVLGIKQKSFTNSLKVKLVMGYFFPSGVFVVEGDQWQRIRKIINVAMSQTSLDPVLPVVCKIVRENFGHPMVNEMKTIDLVSRITFDTFHIVMYGWNPKSINFSKESTIILKCCNTIVEAFSKRNFYPFPLLWKIPTQNNLAADSSAAYLRNFINHFTTSTSTYLNESDKKSLLEALLASKKDSSLTNDELLDQIAMIFFGAYETTSNTLRFILYYLAKFPHLQEKLRTEIFKKFPNGLNEIETSRIEDIEEVKYLGYFIDEVNRLHGIVPFFLRDCIEDCVINGYQVRNGEGVLIDTRTVGSVPEYWNGMQDLDCFRPERWEEHKPNILTAPMPFGFGARICPGRKIALVEMRSIIAAILCSYKVILRNSKDDLRLDMVMGLNIKPDSCNVNYIPITQ